MITQATPISGRAAILAAAGDHPYVRLTTGGRDELPGYLLEDTTVWVEAGSHGMQGYAMGDAERAARFFRDLISAGTLPGLRWLQLPRIDSDTLASYFTVTGHERWDFRWAVTPPPEQPGEERVVRLTEADHDAITALIDESFPATMTRPGHPLVNHWYGIWKGTRLVACGADRSRGGTGFLAGITVATDARGQGLGAALTAAMTRALLAECEEVTLGVMTDNHGAIRLYERLGFAGASPRTSAAVAVG
jgi:GNAT superfamily N-acetyltransferase